MEALLGATLQGKDGAVATVEALAGNEVVGLYFSAHWCGPCRGFTPKLAGIYEQLKKDGKAFEIVFVSSDRKEDQFTEYYNEQPWLALPYADRDTKAKLSKKYKVSGIPALILLDASGKVITKQGREAVTSPEDFPWTPPTVAELLGDELSTPDGASVSVKSLQEAGTHLALYFSAHWCPPCRKFTPALVKTYNKVKAAGKAFEIVFVSSDKDEASFAEYRGEMPWLALPFSKRAEKEKLSTLLGVDGIPTFVMLDPSLKVLNSDAAQLVQGDADGKEFPWEPRKVSPVEEAVEHLNTSPTVLVLMEEAGDKWDEVEAALEAVATEVLAKAPADEDPPFVFAYAQETGGISQQVRKLCGLGRAGAKPDMVLLDLSDDGAYYKHAGEVNQSTIEAFMKGYTEGTLEKLFVEQ